MFPKILGINNFITVMREVRRRQGRREGGKEGGRRGNGGRINSLSTVHTLSRPTMFGCDPRLASCSMLAMRALTFSSEVWSLQHFTATSMALSLLIPLAVPLYRIVEKPSCRISDSWRRSHFGCTSYSILIRLSGDIWSLELITKGGTQYVSGDSCRGKKDDVGRT